MKALAVWYFAMLVLIVFAVGLLIAVRSLVEKAKSILVLSYEWLEAIRESTEAGREKSDHEDEKE